MGEPIVLMSNNATVVVNVKNQGDTVSLVMCDLTQEILIWAEQFAIFLTARYIPGKKIALVDQLSRLDQVLLTE